MASRSRPKILAVMIKRIELSENNARNGSVTSVRNPMSSASSDAAFLVVKTATGKMRQRAKTRSRGPNASAGEKIVEGAGRRSELAIADHDPHTPRSRDEHMGWSYGINFLTPQRREL